MMLLPAGLAVLFQDLLLYIISSLVFSFIMNSLMPLLLVHFNSAVQSVLVGFSSKGPKGPKDTEVRLLEVGCHPSFSRNHC